MGIRISNLVKIYGSTLIVDQISFDVADGEFARPGLQAILVNVM